MLEPRRKLGFCASSVELLFFILNVILLAAGSILAGYVGFAHINPEHPASFGMEEVRLLLTILGAAIVFVSIIGMLVTAQSSRWLCHLFMTMTIIAMTVQCAATIYLTVLQSNSQSRIQATWDGMTPDTKHVFQMRMICCGLKSVADSPDCVASRTLACGSVIMGYQGPLLNTIFTICIGVFLIEVLTVAMVSYLAKQYKRLYEKNVDMTTLSRSIDTETIPTKTVPLSSTRHALPESFRNNPPASLLTPNHNNAKSLRSK